MKLRTPAELRELAQDAARAGRDPLAAIYDAGRMDAAAVTPGRKAAPEPAHILHGDAYVDINDRIDLYFANLAAHRGVSEKQILSHDTSRRPSQARQEIVWILRNVEGLGFADISRIMSRSDHTTTLHSARKVDERIAANPGLRDELLAVAGRGAETDGQRLRSVA